MGHWLTVVFCLVCGFKIQQCVTPDVDQQGFIQTLLDSYDNNVSFPENFYTLLGLICPSSVYCQNDNSSEYGMDNLHFWGTDGDTLQDVANFSISRSKNQTGAIAVARKILKSYSPKLKGCCAPCSCEDVCVERRNCCPALANSLKETHDVQLKNQKTQECVLAGITPYLQTVNYFTASTMASYFMVTDCFSANANDDIAMKCRQPDPEQMKETRPVYSASTKTIYKNEYCANCNDVYQVTPWITVLAINDMVSFTGPYRIPSTPEEIYSHIIRSQKMFSIFYKPPVDMIEDKTTFDCLYIIDDDVFLSDELCYANNIFYDEYKNFFQQTCKYRQFPFYSGATAFENVFCFLCQQTIYGPNHFCKITGKARSDFSFSAVLCNTRFESDFRSDNGIDLDNEPCSCTEYFDDKKNRCRQLICAPGEDFVNCACQSFLHDIAHMPVKIFIQIVPERELLGGLAGKLLSYKPDKNVITATVNKLQKTIVSKFGPLNIVWSSLFREITSSKRVSIKLFNVILATFPNISDDKKTIKILFKALHLGMSVRILGTPMVITLGRIMSSTDITVAATKSRFYNNSDYSDAVLERLWPDDQSISSNFAFFTSTFAETLSKLHYCTRVRLEADEIELLQNNSETVGLTQQYLSYVFWEEDESMCLEEFEMAFIPNSSVTLRITNILSEWFGMWLMLTLCSIEAPIPG